MRCERSLSRWMCAPRDAAATLLGSRAALASSAISALSITKSNVGCERVARPSVLYICAAGRSVAISCTMNTKLITRTPATIVRGDTVSQRSTIATLRRDVASFRFDVDDDVRPREFTLHTG